MKENTLVLNKPIDKQYGISYYNPQNTDKVKEILSKLSNILREDKKYEPLKYFVQSNTLEYFFIEFWVLDQEYVLDSFLEIVEMFDTKWEVI